MELLHEARLDVIKVTGKVYSFQNQPEVSGTPVIHPDTFVDGAGASYGSVLQDAGLYRMWYQAWPADWDGGTVSTVAYAESDDGIEWRKPDIGIVDYGGKKNNLCNLGFHSPSIFIDPDSPSGRRYRATGYSRPDLVGTVGVSRPGYFTAYSADGLNWELDSNEPRWEGGDVITSVYHPSRRAAATALKRYYRLNGGPRRSILIADYIDGAWSEMRSALIPDEFDDLCAVSRGFVSGDYYGMGMMPAGRGMVGFVWQFRHKLPRTSGTEAGVFGATDVTLAFQQNPGDRWVHAAGRRDFLRHSDIPWGRGGIYTAASPVPVGDSQRLYFSGALHTHAWYLNNEWKLQPELRNKLVENGMYRIGYAQLKKNRLFGFRADPVGSLELQFEKFDKPVELRLNYRCEPDGRIRVETEGMSDDLTGDHVDAPVTWNGKSVITPITGEPKNFTIHLESAEVYSYELRAC